MGNANDVENLLAAITPGGIENQEAHIPRAAVTEHKRQPTTKRRTVARRRARKAKQENKS